VIQLFIVKFINSFSVGFGFRAKRYKFPADRQAQMLVAILRQIQLQSRQTQKLLNSIIGR